MDMVGDTVHQVGFPRPTPPYKNRGLKGAFSDSATRRAAAWANSLGFPTTKLSNVKRSSKGEPSSSQAWTSLESPDSRGKSSTGTVPTFKTIFLKIGIFFTEKFLDIIQIVGGNSTLNKGAGSSKNNSPSLVILQMQSRNPTVNDSSWGAIFFGLRQIP